MPLGGASWVRFLLGPLFSPEGRSLWAPAPTAPSPGLAGGGGQTNRPLSPDTEPFHAVGRQLCTPTAGLAGWGSEGTVGKELSPASLRVESGVED